MTYELLSNRNTSQGLQVILQYTNDVTANLFIPAVLLLIFMTILLSSYFSQKRGSGRGDFVASFALAGFITSVTATIMHLIPNLIDLTTFIITIVISFIGILWLLLSKDR